MNYKDLFEYNLGDIVYLKTDIDQKKRMVTCIRINPSGIVYSLSCGSEETWHYGIEITSDVDILIKTEG